MWPSNGNAAQGVEALDAALHNNLGEVVYAHSMGAQVIAKWLREVAPTSDVDPARVMFYCTGNPERPSGRGGYYPGPPNTPGSGYPADCQYRIIDIARKGDYFAASGPFYPGYFVHMSYGSVRSDTPNPLSRTENGPITYLTVP
jgi:hypothetical protein